MVDVVYQKGDGIKYQNRKDITKVVVASDVDEIECYAFDGCSNLTEFDFRDSKVTKIGEGALQSTGIIKIKLPDTLKVIERSVFWSCHKLKEIEVNVEKIKDNTFYDCQSLVKVVLKEGVTTVETNAFEGCPNISTFIWPDSAKVDGGDVFSGCDKLHELAGSKDQEKVIEFLKSGTPLRRLCTSDGKLEDIKKILDKNSEEIKSCSPEGLKVLVEAHKVGLNIKDINNMFPDQYLVKNDRISKLACLEAIIGDRSLGRYGALHETMMAAFRETNVKGLESAVERFAKSPEILDLFAWQQFLQIHHRSNPDPSYFAVELQLLFDATWTVLTQANPKTDEASNTLTKNLKDAIQKYVSDNNSERPNLLPEFLKAVPMSKLQKLAATRIFRAHLSSYIRSGIMYIYYFEVFLYLIFTAIFTRLSVRFKSSINGTYEWDDIVIRDMTIACFFLALYFLLRELAQFHAMYQLELQSNWFKDFWNYIDLVASGGTIVLLEYYFRMGPGPEYEHFASVIALFVWMKVLGFAKAFSQQIATFVLMLSTIFRDLFSFMAVLAIILVMFGHAFYLVLSDNKASDGDEIDFTNISGTAWSLYLMILGSFEFSDFSGVWGQGLFICYSFLVVIILLNVLIAIVSDSYDAVLVTSTELFWRSRLELVAEITTTFKWFLQDIEVWVKRYEDHERKWFGSWGRLRILYGLEEGHAWANGKNKVALGVRILFSPVLLGIAIAIFFLWFLPVYIHFTILDCLRSQSYSDTKELAIKELPYLKLFLGGSNEENNRIESSRPRSSTTGQKTEEELKKELVGRIIVSPLFIALTIVFLIFFWLPFIFVAFMFGKLYDKDEYEKYKGSWNAKVVSTEYKISIIYGFKQDHRWSNKKNKLALLIRILFFPIILIISILMFLLWYLPLYLYNVFLLKTQGPRETSTEVDLELKLDSSNSDWSWSGRVLDIVHRINSVTSVEVNKIDARMTAREMRMAEQIENLKDENKLIMKMLSAVVKKVGAEIEEEGVKDEGRPKDEELKQDDGNDDGPPKSAKRRAGRGKGREGWRKGRRAGKK
ncbi:hypothetical protein TrVE_jg4698 [Triparma verrucosa]|uniref:Polycystin cation channel PKD1/PKD2 domain-containing protein n=1 Tax=Triparma verrucosa TaxID=1606542 RepID=A0A9W7C0Y3_9STRA|nr:hypothetical protein TrVE_jg4698 [Triparma verrucosa]